MRINRNTKISKILKEKPEAIKVIANLNKDFKKLENPILRRSLATRVSVKDAAKIGKVPVETFLNALEDIGFEVDFTSAIQSEKKINKLPPDFSNREIITLDVRPIIAEGKDPFPYIDKTAIQIKPEQILLIINNFEPIPLINHLIKNNFVHWVKEDNNGNYLTYFKLNCKKNNFWQRLFGKKTIPCRFHNTEKNTQTNSSSKEKYIKNEEEVGKEKNFEKIKNQFDGNIKEIDVRHLDMPLPMKTILENLEVLPQGQALYVHHKRVPQFLLPELKKRNYHYTYKTINPDYTILIIYKNKEN